MSGIDSDSPLEGMCPHSATTCARFLVEFEVQTVLRATDVRDALRRAQALGAVEVLAITQEH